MCAGQHALALSLVRDRVRLPVACLGMSAFGVRACLFASRVRVCIACSCMLSFMRDCVHFTSCMLGRDCLHVRFCMIACLRAVCMFVNAFFHARLRGLPAAWLGTIALMCVCAWLLVCVRVIACASHMFVHAFFHARLRAVTSCHDGTHSRLCMIACQPHVCESECDCMPPFMPNCVHCCGHDYIHARSRIIACLCACDRMCAGPCAHDSFCVRLWAAIAHACA